MKILALTRAPRFSPNSVEKDREIMLSVVRLLQGQGHEVDIMAEQDIASHLSPPTPHLILSMGRLPETLIWLKEQEQRGTRVINSADSVALCSSRTRLTLLMQEHNIPMAPSVVTLGASASKRWNAVAQTLGGVCSYRSAWLKRGDSCAQSQGDIVFCRDARELGEAIDRFRSRGIGEWVASEHVEGDLVKFYGIRFSTFFRHYYPTDDSQTKFDDEKHNGTAHHYYFDEEALSYDASRLATYTGTMVYGGDAIIRPDGSYAIIDFNDWPSFSRCREEAARGIASIITK